MDKILNSFKDLSVWQKASDLAVLVYSSTEQFPKSELYGIVNQMRRAGISITSNIAEGFKRIHKKEKMQFYNIAYSSLAELESQIEVAYKLNFLGKEDYEKLIFSVIEVSKMANGLIKSLNPKSYILSSNGFTLVEVIVAVGLFSVVVGIAVGSFVQALRTQRQVSGFIAAESNVGLVAEQMAREIRTGYNFCNPGGGSTCAGPSDINFTNAAGEAVGYRLNGSFIERGVGGVFGRITSGNVSIAYLQFIVSGNQSGDGWPPRITVSLGVSPKEAGASASVLRLQTTISARIIDT